ncbi:envelope stress response membrane protein PspB [Serratia microhaemolytica]|uniref:envelope stress response membrane protein PspB n=1 Tax=Serratia microhaemolytica TaxID=2675110 RepID=UPI000FDD591B|nr:envelope stress response membrane protein PspB [Serratia microhaemolytica]
MSGFFLFIPLTIFVVFIVPIWLWLHYRAQKQSGGELDAQEMSQLTQLSEQSARMRARLQVLEDILDAEHPNWRQS